MRNGQEAEAGRALVRPQQLPVDQGGPAAALGSGFWFGSDSRATDRVHVGAGLWEVSTQPPSFLLENLTVLAQSETGS